MNPTTQVTAASGAFRRAGVKETTVLLFLAWLVPFLVHLLPWQGSVPLGAHLLPMFWTAFVAVYLFGLGTGLLVALFAPVLNLVLTGLPQLGWLSVLAFELVVFSVFAWWTVRRTPRLWLIAPMGYVVARVLSGALQLLLAGGRDLLDLQHLFVGSLRQGLPGLAVLAAVNFALVRLYPKSARGDGDDAAAV